MAEVDIHQDEIVEKVTPSDVEIISKGVSECFDGPTTQNFNNRDYYDYHSTGYATQLKIPFQSTSGWPLFIFRSTPLIAHPSDSEVRTNFLPIFSNERPAFLNVISEDYDRLSGETPVGILIDSMPPQISRDAEVHRYMDGGLKWLLMVTSTVNTQGVILVEVDDDVIVSPIKHNAFRHAPPIYFRDSTMASSMCRNHFFIDLSNPQHLYEIEVPRTSPTAFDMAAYRMMLAEFANGKGEAGTEKITQAQYADLTSVISPPSLVFRAVTSIASTTQAAGTVEFRFFVAAGPGFRLSGSLIRPCTHIQRGDFSKVYKIRDTDTAATEKQTELDQLTIKPWPVPSNTAIPPLVIRPDTSYKQVDERKPPGKFSSRPVLPAIEPGAGKSGE